MQVKNRASINAKFDPDKGRSVGGSLWGAMSLSAICSGS